MSEKVERPRLLLVDDQALNLRILVEFLKGRFDLVVATSGEQALLRVAESLPDLILLDIMMPGMDGYEVCGRLKSDPRTEAIPIIFISALDAASDESKGLGLGAVDYISKPFNPAIVVARVLNHIELKRHRDDLERLVAERTREVELTQAVTFLGMGTLAEFRDPETGNHIQRTSHYVRIIAERVAAKGGPIGEIGPRHVDLLARSAPLHDIGKVGIPDSILLKPAKLTPEETRVMRRHAWLGFQALRKSVSVLGATSFLDVAMDVTYTHHEHWDGSGYPRGLRGEEIPLAGRIMAIADVYDALRSRRPYKEPFNHEATLGVLREGAGTAFDPGILDLALDAEEEFAEIAERFSDEAREKRSA